MRRLTLDGLELIDAIARSGSFSGAANVLNKATSTISYAVAKLEDDLQVELFHRNGPRVSLTRAGNALLEDGRVLLLNADELEHRIKRIADGWESELRIAVDSLIPPVMLSGLIERFGAEASGTRLKLMSETLTGTWEALKDNRADIVVATGPSPTHDGVRTKKVAELAFVFCVAPQHPLATWDGAIPSTELRQHRLVVASDSARQMPTRTIGLLGGQPTLAVPDLRTKYAMQVAGLGVGYLPKPLVQSALARGLLIEKPTETPKPDDQVNVAWRTHDTGRALAWWREALCAPNVVPTFINRASHAWVTEY